ncbi:hypothetical protein EDE15_1673 [Edaphobacter aggregans]|uniref:Uncharacterized protein n=1 Tax=Edaphobacter aggregans TaxID=570835 RepID=A0A3R9NXP5_9BACT|nr:hypothetical protein [Edaphobacter aggregans]RSL16163.1 hypothetical protein EDE15_1673 [Edaphobacter aggregans]
MRILLKLLLLLSASQLALAQRATFTLPETGQVITFSFHPVSDPSDNFDSVDVTSADKHFHFPAKNTVARFPATAKERRAEGFWIDIPGLKLHPSRYFLVGNYGTATDVHSLLFFVGAAYASEASPLLVLGFSATGEPYKVLERQYLDVTSFQLAPDGTPLIVGKDALSEVMRGDGGNGSAKPYATTYDPFSVFTLRSGEKAVYSLEESRNYNLKHYVWAGPHSREDFAVFYNIPGHPKPLGAPISRAETLLGGSK